MQAGWRKVRNANGVMGYAALFPFIYTVIIPTAALAAGGSVAQSLQLEPGLPFLLTGLSCAVDADTATLSTLTQWGAQILDNQAQLLFGNGEVPREHMFGTRDFPRQLPAEVQLNPGDQLTFTFWNRTGAAQTTNIRASLIGFKLGAFTTQPPS